MIALLLLGLSLPLAFVPDAEIAALIELLDSDRFAEREAAQRALLGRGELVLPAIMAARSSERPEIAIRCRQIYRQLHHQTLVLEFRRLAQLPLRDQWTELEYGLFLIARIQDPLANRAAMERRFDDLAQEVRELIAQRGATTPRQQLAALHEILFVKHGFTGNEAHYQHCDNSSLVRVLATQRGLPLSLSQVTIAVARRVGITLHGVALPRRYLVWYAPPPGRAADEWILDPFDHGKELTRDDLEDLLAGLGTGFDQASDLRAALPRETLVRALRNLRSHSIQAGLVEQATACTEYLAAFGEVEE